MKVITEAVLRNELRAEIPENVYDSGGERSYRLPPENIFSSVR